MKELDRRKLKKKDKGLKLLPYGGGDPLKTYRTPRIYVITKTKHDICKFLVEGNYGYLMGFQFALSGIVSGNKQSQESRRSLREIPGLIQ